MPNSHRPLGPRPHAALRAGIVLWSLVFGACGSAGPTEPEPGQTTVLFIGSSYLAFNDVPGLLGGFARKAGEDVFVRSHLLLGHYLDYFAADVQTTLLLRERDWDFGVLQGGARNAMQLRIRSNALKWAGQMDLRVAEMSYDWELDQSLARDLRAVASRTVRDSLALWNIRQRTEPRPLALSIPRSGRASPRGGTSMSTPRWPS